MGWFRSDPLEEIVGLDTSYHGGVLLGGSDVEPEYISAYKERRESRRQSRGSFNNRDNGAETTSMWMEEEEEDVSGSYHYGDSGLNLAEGDEDEEAFSIEEKTAEEVLFEEDDRVDAPLNNNSEHGSMTA